MSYKTAMRDACNTTASHRLASCLDTARAEARRHVSGSPEWAISICRAAMIRRELWQRGISAP